MPALGIYAGSALGHRAAISIGTNPHYGGTERRVEAYLLDYDGDLYGQRLIVELWERLRDEAAFASEAELVAAIATDVRAREPRAARRSPRPTASFRHARHLLGMDAAPLHALNLCVLESVRCLECGEVYAKPVAGGTCEKNPGCPAVRLRRLDPAHPPPERASLRSGAGRPRLRSVPAR